MYEVSESNINILAKMTIYIVDRIFFCKNAKESQKIITFTGTFDHG